MAAFFPDTNGVLKGTGNSDDITWGNIWLWQRDLTVNAGAGNDYIDFELSRYKNTLNGEDGNDTIQGGTKTDIISGGAGSDMLYGNDGSDKIYGNTGSDRIYGGFGNDYIDGGSGNDKIYGEEENDTINAGTGNDSVEGGIGNDVIYGQAGNDSLYGGIGNDTIYGTSGNNKLYGGNGMDSLYGGSGNDFIDGGAGLDRIFALAGNDTIYGGDGKDSVDAGDGDDLVYGGLDNDTLKGNNGNDVIYGESGDDKLFGMKGDDSIKGGTGHDLLDGSDGNDTLIAEAGNDTIRAGIGDDSVDGGAGDDQIVGHGGNDIMYGGSGNDFLDGGNGSDKIYGQAGNDLIRGGSDDDYIYGGDGDDNLQGQYGNNFILGEGGNDTVFGGKGNDNINGGADDDKLYGQDGNDSIYSGAGNDYVDGGSGDDIINIDGGGNNTVYGASGNDFINLFSGTNTVKGGVGNDTINVTDGTNFLHFKKGDGNDIILNTSGYNTILFDDDSYISQRESGNNLIITYGASETITIRDYTSQRSNFNIVYSNTPDNPPVVPDDADLTLSRGAASQTVNLNTSDTFLLKLKNTFDGKVYSYELKSTSSNQTATIEYLSNGRLYIKGSYITLTAKSGQDDSLIIQGNHNTINTGDRDDIVRVGTVTDGNGYYDKQSNYNTINTGAGNDYVNFFGYRNAIDTGAGKDFVYSAAYNVNLANETINNAETITKFADNGTSVNGKIDYYNQGTGGGDCRFLSIIQSLAYSVNFNLSNYITITSSGSSYNVKYKNYTNGTNVVNVTAAEIADNSNVYGDLDVVLANIALNKLIALNKDADNSSIRDADYNTLSDYFFGTRDTTYIYQTYRYNFSDRLTELWNEFKSGNLTNITIAILGNEDYSQGIISGHAYAIKELTDSYIKLVNVWDSMDYLQLDTSKFYNMSIAAFGYGYDYYNEHYTLKQGTDSVPDKDYMPSICELTSEISSWNSSSKTADIIAENISSAEKFDLTAYFVKENV